MPTKNTQKSNKIQVQCAKIATQAKKQDKQYSFFLVIAPVCNLVWITGLDIAKLETSISKDEEDEEKGKTTWIGTKLWIGNREKWSWGVATSWVEKDNVSDTCMGGAKFELGIDADTEVPWDADTEVPWEIELESS